MTIDTRDKILQSSLQLMLVQGYNHTGINQILQQVNVPKGSFYHYFKSKEALGLALVQDNGDLQVAMLTDLLAKPNQSSAIAALEAVFEYLIELFASDMNFCNCLLSNFAQEMALQSDTFRHAIDQQFLRLERIYAEQLRAAKAQHQLADHVDIDMLAQQLQSGWSGNLMRAKLLKSVQPLQQFKQFYFKNLQLYQI